MTNKEKLDLISNIENLKDIVLKSFDYRDDINSIPNELKNSYVRIIKDIKQNNNYKKFPLLLNLLEADSLNKAIQGLSESFKILDIKTQKQLWNDSYEHSINEIDLTNNSDISTIPTDLSGNIIKSNNHIKITKIELHNFRFFTNQNNIFEPNSNGMLIYGENGSGKSSIFKAFEFLSKISKENISQEFKNNKNIHHLEEESSIIFEFDNGEVLEINDDSDINTDLNFINNLSIFMPMLNYQNLLKISYETTSNKDKNLYRFFENILENYPIGNGKILKNLKENEDENYFDIFEDILKNQLFDNINMFLYQFKQNFKLTNIKFNKGFQKITLEIDLFDKNIDNYHTFLNEARLSSLAISIYFAIIKKQFELLEENSLKILVLDDLLISLDMDNRINLLNILKNEFSDFQIFFFTHDKNLSELIKSRLDLKNYELYVDLKNNSDNEFEVPFLKKSKNLLEEAKHHKIKKEYDCCANKLRQYLEKELNKMLESKDLFDTNCIKLDLSKLLNKSISIEKQKEEKNYNLISNLEKLQVYRKILLNSASHYDNTNIYKKELEEVIEILEYLK